jgi:hypothetical protein
VSSDRIVTRHTSRDARLRSPEWPILHLWIGSIFLALRGGLPMTIEAQRLSTAISRRRILELSWLGVVLPSESSSEQQTVAQAQRLTTRDGELILAWYKSEGKTVLVLARGASTPQGYQSQLLFNEDTSTLLNVTANMPQKPEDGKVGQVNITATGSGVNYSLSVDATTVSLEPQEDRRPPKGSAKVQIKIPGKTFEGNFDFEAWKLRGLEGAPHLDVVLPSRVKEAIAPLRLSLEESVKRYSDKSGGLFPPAPGQRPPDARWRGKLCRAACWAGAGAAGTACCGGTAGVGCIICMTVAGIAASLCSDACPS